MYGEPVKSLKTTFCVWLAALEKWCKGISNDISKEDGSKEMLDLLDGSPQKYVDFCKWYYETDVPLELVEKIYRGETLTLEMVKVLNHNRNDISAIKKELEEIGYPNTL